MELTEKKSELSTNTSPLDLHQVSVNNSIDVRNETVYRAPDEDNVYQNTMVRWTDQLKSCLKRNNDRILVTFKVVLFVLYLAYFGYAQKCFKNDEPSWRLIGITIFGAVLLSWRLLMKTGFKKLWTSFTNDVGKMFSKGKRATVIRWLLYIAMTIFSIVYVIVEIAFKTPDNLRSLMGIFVFPAFLFLYSNNRSKINWHTIFWGMSSQFLMALLVLKTAWGAGIIRWLGTRVEEYLSNGHAGSLFLFGENYKDHAFAFGTTIQAYVLMVGLSVITYLGVTDAIVRSAGRVLAFCLQTTAPEGINAIANIFLHLPESAMVIQNSLNAMTPSQLFVTYAGGMATVGGLSLVIFLSYGVPASHLVAASSMSAPAALAAAKLVFPSHDGEIAPQPDSKDEVGIIRKANTLMESIVIGIGQATQLIIQGCTFAASFIMILEFGNRTCIWFGNRIDVEDMSIEYLCSYLFYPIAFLMGAPSKDCLKIGELIAVRSLSLAVLAFQRQGVLVKNGELFREYLAASPNNTWVTVGDDIYLPGLNKTLINGVMEPRSDVIATYALCGSASFAIAGFMIGNYKAMMPHRLTEVTNHAFRAVVAGSAASFLTACFAGLLYEEGI